MHQRSLFFIALISLLLIFTLAGCGGGGGGSSTSTQLESALRTAFQTNLTFPANPVMPNSSGTQIRAQGACDVTWTSATFSNIQYSNVVANVVITDPTATATATFTVSGHYDLAGTNDACGEWTASGNFILAGAGTVNFRKVGDVWRVESIPGGITLTSNPSAPSIGRPNLSPNPVAQSALLRTVATITSNSTDTHRVYLVGTRGFGYSSVVPLYYSPSATYSYEHIGAVDLTAPIGNNFGAINVWQLVEVNATTFQPYFSAYINFVVVSAYNPN